MDKKHKYLLIDTETANGLDDPLCYNFAGAVIDRYGNVYETGNFINADVFFDKPELMQTAYYASKIPEYLEQVKRGEIQIKSWFEIKNWVWTICAKYGIKAVIAHNARFDYRSCTKTQRFETCSKYRYFFPRNVEIWDTLSMAKDVLNQMPTYLKWCTENGLVKKNGEPRHTAEVIYRFIMKDTEFEEEHKAMEDVAIECEIFWYLTRQHKPMKRKCFKD